jgi:branched-chain amino acid transport system permease protein
MLFGQLVFDGLAMGLVFVVLATGLVLISSVNRILFMAYGVFYTIGAYATWWVMHIWSLPYAAALVLGVLLAAVIGILSYLLIFRRLQRSEGGFLATLIASMGLSMMLTQGDLLIFGTTRRSIATPFPGAFSLGGINITNAKLALIIFGVAITIILFLLYEKTRVGRAMRTVAFMPEVASIHGVNISRVYMWSLGVGCGLAGIAGAMLAPTYGLSPSMGNSILWTVLLMTMLGGMDSLLGAVVGGVVIGQLLSFGQYYIGGLIQIVIFLIIGVVLYFKPNGILGRGIDIGI